jgi:HTH-type transcriptional regulator/antitoxin HipB
MQHSFPTDLYVVRARRLADLSQRGLAELLDISASTIQRVETAQHDLGVGAFVGILGVAGLRLAVVDHLGREVDPIPVDVVRDNAGRRFPAHLDVDPPDLVPPLRRLMPRYDRPPARGWYRQRPERDRLRGVAGEPPDHPTVDQLSIREAELARDRVGPRVRDSSSWENDECDCDTECWLGTTCERDCPCQCEPGPVPGSA